MLLLLILSVANEGELVELRTGATVPLKLIMPVDEEVIAFTNWIV